MNTKFYKCCAVPMCMSTSVKTPNKLFIHVPKNKHVRKKWLTIASRDSKSLTTSSTTYFCEDHFDLSNDMENYMEYHVMGSVSQVRMRPGCVPKKFACQQDRIRRTGERKPRPYVAKKQRMKIVKECEEQYAESIVKGQTRSEEIASASSENTAFTCSNNENMNNPSTYNYTERKENEDICYLVPVGSVVLENTGELSVDRGAIDTEDTINRQTSPLYVAVEEIKIEYDDTVNQGNISTEHTTSSDTVCRSTTTGDVTCNIKAENHDVESGSTTDSGEGFVTDDMKVEIKQEIITPEESTNIELMCRSTPLVEINSIKVENCDPFEDIEDESGTVGEDYSAAAGLPAAETIHKVQLSDTAVQQVTQAPDNSKCLRSTSREHAGEKLFTCDVCNKTFKMKRYLLYHMKVHSESDRLVCHVCEKVFTTKYNLERHLKVHLGEKSFSCDLCHKAFAQKKHLEQHIKRHSGEKPFSCVVCNKKFKSKSNIVQHLKTHSEEKPFSCDVCNKAFTAKSGLVKHSKIHLREKPFSCYVCGKEFHVKFHLDKHINAHLGIKPFVCHVCNQAFTDKSYLVQHINGHLGITPFVCHICNKTFTVKCSLVSHMKIHSGEKPFQCDVCNKKFTAKSNFNKHRNSHLGIKPYSCRVCNQKYAAKVNLVQHMRRHSEKKASLPTKNMNITNQEYISTDHTTSSDMVCRSTTTEDVIHDIKAENDHDVECGSTTTEALFAVDIKVEIKQEIVTAEEYTNISFNSVKVENCVMSQDGASEGATGTDVKRGDVSLGEDYSSAAGLPAAETMHKVQLSDTAVQQVTKAPGDSTRAAYNVRTSEDSAEKPFSCNICDKAFSFQLHLVRHIKTHSGEKSFTCHVCNKTFKTNRNLVEHLRIHSGEKPFTCEICHKAFTRRSDITSHRKIHSGEKPFSCEICHKEFASKSVLVKHVRTHTGEKPFSCKVCDKRFKQKVHLTTHMKTHSGEKQFSCEICHKAFIQKLHLIRHIRTHTGEKPYSCEVCPKKFISKGSLTAHTRTHSEKKPFSCEICYKTFAQKCRLIAHTALHSGIKPFSCDICNTEFTVKSNLLVHKRKHSREKPCV